LGQTGNDAGNYQAAAGGCPEVLTVSAAKDSQMGILSIMIYMTKAGLPTKYYNLQYRFSRLH
jgi:hypothetical protein